MLKALVIGCGNIGAWYDYNNDQVLTHAKAYFLDPRFSLSIFDINKTIVENISARYHCEVLGVIDAMSLKAFDCISICTPTNTHSHFLKMAIDAGVKAIVCEKPISNDLGELEFVASAYRNGKSKIIVNYIRRFQPAFIELKKFISKLITEEKVTNIDIRYQRGFINNCSHAFDTIEFLMDCQMNLEEIKYNNVVFDQFNNDPTLSLQAIWNKTNVSIIGLSNICFSHFEFDIYFEYHKVCIKNAGQIVEIYKAEKAEKFFQPLNIQDQYTRNQCLKDYMKNVVDCVYQLSSQKDQKDNFLQSINLNQRMLNYLSF
jgi:predicted dehydrogenase